MDIDTVHELLMNGENETVEAKSNGENFLDLQKTVCAFANTKGGHLIIGVAERDNPPSDRERFRYDGVVATRGLLRRLHDIGNSLVPGVTVEVDQISLQRNNSIFVIGVSPSDARIALKDGTAYQRKGAATVKLLPNEQGAKLTTTAAQRRAEELRILRDLLTRKAGSVRASDVAESTAIELDRVEAHLELIGKSGVFRKTLRTNQGLIADVTQGDLLKIEGRIDDLAGSSDELNMSDQAQAEIVRTADVGERNLDADALKRQSIIDNSEAAVSLRQNITEAFNQLPSDQQPSFARIQLGPGALESEWEFNFLDLLNNSRADKLNSIATVLDEFRKRNGRYLGDRSNYRRDATEQEECLNITSYVRVLTRFFSSTSDDVCFGLFGHWGRGKSTMIKRVGKSLIREHQYEVIKFSAWKYRTNPELWIHLYQSTVNTMQKGDWFVRLFVPFRAALARSGIWPVVVLLACQAIALIPFADKYWIARFAFQFLGIGGLIYFVFFYLRVRRLALGLGAYFQIADHSSKLGLQATIGDDLKYLLCGWMPRYQWLRTVSTEPVVKGGTAESQSDQVAFTNWLGIGCYYALAIYSLFLLYPGSSTQSSWLGRDFDMSIPPWLVILIEYVWALLVIAFPLMAFNLAKGPKRVLLVVDDLDRCAPSQILEIVESIMLLLDDDEIKSRLQVAVLVEEEAVQHAIAEKYRYMWDEKYGNKKPSRRSEVIKENLEKLFLVHLRLGVLNVSEILEVADHYTREGRNAHELITDQHTPKALGEIHSKGYQASDEVSVLPDSKEIAVRPVPSSEVSDDEVFLTLTKFESKVLMSELQASRIGAENRWGPRAIRCLLNKYVLARELLQEIHPDNLSDPRDLARSLLHNDESFEEHVPRPSEHMEFKGVEYVSRLVK